MSTKFQAAIKEYRYLKTRNYPERAALKLVGDRHRLSTLERNCLFRAVMPGAVSLARRRKLLSAPALAGMALGVDWYNVLITVESYLKGCPVFLADDGIVRDSAGVHGSYHPSRVTDKAIAEILGGILQLQPLQVDLFLDSPIPHSGLMAAQLRSSTEDFTAGPMRVWVIPSADYLLKTYPGVVASSDSIIMDQEAANAFFDLPRFILKRSFLFAAPTLRRLRLPAAAQSSESSSSS